MAKQMITVHDVETDTIVTREMTEQELSEHQSVIDQIEADKAKIAKAEADKAELLSKLGITADEARLLLN
jgi:hypothetical protein